MVETRLHEVSECDIRIFAYPGYIAAATYGAEYRIRKHKNIKTAQQLGQLESSARLNFLLQFACPIM